MQETGKVIFVDEVKRGISTKSGKEWQSQRFVLEVQERYPRRVACTIMGQERVEKCALKLGETLTIVGAVNAHEFNGSWFNEVEVYDVLDGGRSRLITI